MWSPFKKKPAKRRKAAPKRRRANPTRSVRSFEVYNPRSGQSLGRYRASSAQHAIAAAIRDAGYRAHVSTRTHKVVSNAPGMGSLSARAVTRANPSRRRKAAPARRRRRTYR